MKPPFDPYLEWLGIDGEGIPTHYELFELAPKESDASVIQKGVDARLAQIRAIRPGEHLDVWRQLVAYLEDVRAVLLDPKAKADYDAALPDPPPDRSGAVETPQAPTAVPPGVTGSPLAQPRSSGSSRRRSSLPLGSPDTLPVGTPVAPGAQLPSPEVPSGIPVGIPVGRPVVAEESWDAVDVTAGSPIARGFSPLKPRQRGLSNNQLMVLFILGILIAGGIAYGLLKLRQREHEKRIREKPPAEAAEAVPRRRTHPLNDESVVPRERRTLAPLVGRKDTEAEMTDTRGGVEPPRATAAETPAADPAHAPQAPPPAVREPTGSGDRFESLLNEARLRLGERDLAGATRVLDEARKLADAPARTAEWDQVCSMRDLVGAFWDALRDELARRRNEPMSVGFSGGTAQFVVVECDRNRLVIRKEGETLTYDVGEMPHNLVLLMARNLLEQDGDGAAMTGAFIAMEPEGDRTEARRLFEKAARTRQDIHRVLPELDAPRPRVASETRLPVPSGEKALTAAQLKVKREFQELYEGAKSGPKQLALAQTLREAAALENSEPSRRFVLYEEAVRFAVAAGSLEEAFRSVDAMSRAFAIDAVEKKTAVLSAVVRGAVGSRKHREIVPLALELAREAAEAGRENQLNRVIETAKESARKTGSATTMKEVLEFSP